MLAVASSSHWGNANWADKKVEVRGKISELEVEYFPMRSSKGNRSDMRIQLQMSRPQENQLVDCFAEIFY